MMTTLSTQGQKNAAIVGNVLRAGAPAVALGAPAALAVGAGIVGAGGMVAGAAVATAGATANAAANINEIQGGNEDVTKALRLGGLGAQVGGMGMKVAGGSAPSTSDGIKLAKNIDGVK
mmetsp:Transcript_88848/g.157426  ORF Transcript_88848/g.157426 Transcript_88848/m.157426 type:complete len:119 (-) Transcript_88848:26-382(-)